MRTMKDSGIEWIGQIPQEWEISRVKHLYDVTLGKMLQPAPKSDDDELCSYMCAANINWSGVDLSVEKKMWFSAKDKESYRLAAGDLLVTEGGDVAVSCIWNDELPECYIQNAVHRVRPKSDASNRYLYYWLSTLKATGYIDLVCNKATLAHFTKDKFDSCVIPVVSADEQHTIANYLDIKCAEIDALIAAKEKTNALLKERRQSIIYEAVTKGLNPDAPMKDSGIEWIGQIPAHWERISLKYCIQHVGSGTSVNAEDRPANTDEMGVLKTSCVSSGTFVAVENKTILEGEHDRASCPVKADTVIVSRMNTPDLVGACGYVEEDYPNLYLPDRLWQVEFNEDCIAKYMWYFLTSKYVRNYYASVCTGTSGSMQNISQDQFGAIAFFKPTKAEQQQIVEQLDKECNALMLLIEINEISLRKLKEYRQSVIYEAVTGKVEI